MFRREADEVAGTEEPRPDLHEEPDPLMIRWMPVMVPLTAALVLGMALLVWWAVL